MSLRKAFIFSIAISTFAHACVSAIAFAQVITPAPSTQVEITSKSSEIDNLEKQITQFEKEIGDRKTRQRTLANDIALLDARIKKSQLEIKRLTLQIEHLDNEIKIREAAIAMAETDIVRRKSIIASHLNMLATESDRPSVLLFIANGRFSDFFSQLQSLEDLEQKLYGVLLEVKGQKKELEVERERLSQDKAENEELHDLQIATKDALANNSKQKQNLLTVTKGEEKKFQQLVKTSKADIEKLKNEIYYLQRIGVTAEQAASLGALVAGRIGIRPAFLIAILEIESRMGANVGKGTYLLDMNPNQHEAFLKICKELGLDPNKTPVSKKPSYGWGGAMGPAQFLPQTWLGYRDRVATFTGRSANPWNIEDAFFAAAIKLGAQGAALKTTAGELAAAKAYIGGSPNCSKDICNYYANLAIDKASDIEKTL